jgi:hypothetical protein
VNRSCTGLTPRSVAVVTLLALALLSGCAGTVSPGAGGGTTPPPGAISVTMSLPAATVQVGTTQMFSAMVANDSGNKGVSWALSATGCSGATCGTVSPATSASGAAVTYTAPATVPNPATVTLTATSVADGTKSAATTITLSTTPATLAVTLSLSTASVTVSGTQAFSATVTGDSASKGVTWSVSGAGCSGATCGTVSPATSASGVAVTYTAPAAVPTPAAVTLKATSVADTTKTAAATITVLAAAAPVAVTLSLSTASVAVNGTQAFTATVANDSANKGVNWTVTGTGCSGATCGTVSPATSTSGSAVTYAAPGAVPNPATVTLRATSVTDGTKSATATITITAASGGVVAVTLTPKRGGIVTGQSLSFTAAVANDTGNQGVTWSATGGTFGAQTATTATYVAPATAGSMVVTATSKADVTKSASATIGITDLLGVLTYHNNNNRDGSNTREFALTPANVTTSSFGKLFSCNADGAIYAQPLWVPKASIGGGTHNIIVAATMRDSVFVFDADANPCVTYWSKNLIPTGEIYGNNGDVGSADIFPDIGILGTPVIDSTTSTIYVVTKTKNSGTSTFHQRIHALSLTDGSEKFGGPTDITSAIAVPGTGDGGSGGNVPFDALKENQRCGLALVNGVVYVTWASHGDNGPYHGWIVGYSAGNLAQAPVVFNDTPNGSEGGIWMSGGAPASDDANNLYVISGNGSFDKAAPRKNYGMAFMKLSTAGGLGVGDFFSPMNEDTLSGADQDFGSGGAAVLIDANTGPFPRLVVGGGKDQQLFVLNRDNMGGYSASGNNVVQTLAFGNGIFATASFWNNNLYLAGSGALKAFSLNPATSQFGVNPTSQSTATYGFPGSSPSVSASGTTNGIVWAMSTNAFGMRNGSLPPNPPKAAGPTILRAYDATSLNTELWNSTQASAGRDTAGNAVKFTVPTVANGKVYIGTRGTDDSIGNGNIFGQINVYGLLPN